MIANAGTTNTGAVDPLPALADVAANEALWLHVDGAYGAPAVVCERGQERLTGLNQADSLTMDPHKWLFQPFEIGGVLVRDGRHLRRAFRMGAEYLEDAMGEDDEVNFSAYGIQLTRSFRALKLWMTLKVFGRTHVAAAVERGFELAEQAEQILRGRSGVDGGDAGTDGHPHVSLRARRLGRRRDRCPQRAPCRCGQRRGRGVPDENNAGRAAGPSALSHQSADNGGGPARHDQPARPAPADDERIVTAWPHRLGSRFLMKRYNVSRVTSKQQTSCHADLRGHL